MYQFPGLAQWVSANKKPLTPRYLLSISPLDTRLSSPSYNSLAVKTDLRCAVTKFQ